LPHRPSRPREEGLATLHGFQDHGYRSAILIALTADAAAVVTLVAYLATRPSGRAEGLGVAPADRVAPGLRIGEQHPEDVGRHQHHYEHGYHLDEHVLVIPASAASDPNHSAGIRRDDQPRPRRSGQASASLRRVSRRCSGMTLMSASTGMKFVSPFQRGTTWRWPWSTMPAPATRPRFQPTLNPSGAKTARSASIDSVASRCVSRASASSRSPNAEPCRYGATIRCPEA